MRPHESAPLGGPRAVEREIAIFSGAVECQRTPIALHLCGQAAIAGGAAPAGPGASGPPLATATLTLSGPAGASREVPLLLHEVRVVELAGATGAAAVADATDAGDASGRLVCIDCREGRFRLRVRGWQWHREAAAAFYAALPLAPATLGRRAAWAALLALLRLPGIARLLRRPGSSG